MDIDLTPYKGLDEKYTEAEQSMMLYRMFQGAEGDAVSDDDAVALAEWVDRFQRTRSIMSLCLRGLALPGMTRGVIGFKLGSAESVAVMEDVGWVFDEDQPGEREAPNGFSPD